MLQMNNYFSNFTLIFISRNYDGLFDLLSMLSKIWNALDLLSKYAKVNLQ